jgi:hypothetical protein
MVLGFTPAPRAFKEPPVILKAWSENRGRTAQTHIERDKKIITWQELIKFGWRGGLGVRGT